MSPSSASAQPTSGPTVRRSNRLTGFTVIELLTVIAILGVLMSIAITAGRGIQERSKIARAKADMAVLAAALEQYKQHYGDYPWGPDADGVPDGGAIMFNALCGNIGPKGNTLPARGRMFVELSKFTLANQNVPDPDASPSFLGNWFNDPWTKPNNTNWYYYAYKKSESDPNWKSPGFLLYSHGPDGECNLGVANDAPANSGYLENFPSGYEAVNADNVYYGKD